MPAEARGAEVATLPRGRHSPGPRVVAASQRQRLLRAMTEEVAERGYAGTTATAVYRRARVSSRAFYEHFADVHDCFLAAYEDSVRTVLHALADALGPPPERPPPADPMDRLGAMLDAYLGLLAAHPTTARTFLVEVYNAGPAARRRRLAVHDQFVDAAQALLGSDLGAASERIAVEALIDAITFRVTRLVMAGGIADPGRVADDLRLVARRLLPELDHPR